MSYVFFIIFHNSLKIKPFEYHRFLNPSEGKQIQGAGLKSLAECGYLL